MQSKSGLGQGRDTSATKRFARKAGLGQGLRIDEEDRVGSIKIKIAFSLPEQKEKY
ncbi:MAG: hypothetical protein KAV83_11955 [Desulfobacterales bacterium]|nr:hypothetical protein [Desulfobacterales bacterium]